MENVKMNRKKNRESEIEKMTDGGREKRSKGVK